MLTKSSPSGCRRAGADLAGAYRSTSVEALVGGMVKDRLHSLHEHVTRGAVPAATTTAGLPATRL